MHYPGEIILTLRPGYTLTHIPTHVDCLLGAGRPVGRLDGGALDRLLRRWGDGFRASSVYPARQTLGTVGEQHTKYDDVEESLGLSRTYKIELGRLGKTWDTIAALRDATIVESVTRQTLAIADLTPPIAPPSVPARRLTRADAQRPHDMIHAAAALALEPGDERITVAVVDTGVSLGHPEFRRKLLAGYDTVDLGMGAIGQEIILVGDSLGHDFTPRDETGHGSSVAGVLGAQGWRIPPGVSGCSLVLPVRVLAAARLFGERTKLIGVGGLSDIDAGLKVAVDLGAHVINMSFGTPAPSLDPSAPPPHTRPVAYATHYGCILIAAAGNSGQEEAVYPAALPEVIAVGAVNEYMQRARFSTLGPHLALCAPGERIVSAGRRGYQVNSGTSFAAPFVSGIVALLLSRARRARRKLDGADVRRLLTTSTTPLGDGRFSFETGHGLLNATGALRRLETELASDQSLGRPI
jgi:subtilisin family serine protease